ncbi:hypothetical protein ILUMI_22887 [Ignelater luminosus]|uniref:Uncharacterized protein n=1 Tax=Ignelater luminosus TaxID=2038154 RepID=A0A8K0C9T8_IGNLU|nr:hypothetical protein ILUMI_22887 [Ignelater luminosus]
MIAVAFIVFLIFLGTFITTICLAVGFRNSILATRALARRRERIFNSNQTTDVWNISGRVNHQDGPVTSEPQRWPTHDHHVSLDSFVIPETHQHNKKDRIPPPPYSEVDLPTYEQATALPRPKDELASVHVVPSSSRNCDANAS